MSNTPIKSDAPFYTDDALYERDPVLAMRISREQLQLQKQLELTRAPRSISGTWWSAW